MTKKKTTQMDVHPYPQDITADPFIVFGGLFSRKVIQKYLLGKNAENPQVFQDLVRLADQCSVEKALQQGFEDSLNRNGIPCSKVNGELTCDRLIGDRFLVEIKLDKHNNDPQFWQGSTDDANAVIQTRRYLNESSRDWAVLTNGKVVRFMHKDHGLNFIDLWICDAALSGPTPHANFFAHAMKDPSILDQLLSETIAERDRFTKSYAEGMQTFWDKYKKLENKPWNVALVEATLCTTFLRYLEDVGILPILDEEYKKYSLLKPVSKDQLVERLKTLRSQRFLTSEKVEDASDILSDATIERIDKVLTNKSIFADFQNIFWDKMGPVDVSDLKVAFFGDAYQLFANKTDINGVDGQYFTGSELARETAIYFVEDEKRGISKDEIIYDPFVGSGQLLRALVPFFHLLLQGEVLEPSIISGMRRLAERLAGTDIDENACWLARLNLALVTAERGKPLMNFSSQILTADVFETCFGYTESRWQQQLGIKGNIRGIITNPPWRLLQQTTNELYSIETGEKAPLRSNPQNWSRYKKWLIDGGKKRADKKSAELKILSKKHKETFKRTGQRKINVAISGLDFVDRIAGAAGKKWVAFMPDSFFVGQNGLRLQKDFIVRRYYSYPHNDHFEGTDSVMKFGVVFGGGSPQKPLFCHPMGHGRIDVRAIFNRIGVLPIFGTTEEALAQAIWYSKAVPVSDWKNGEFNETTAPKRGAKQATGNSGTPVRGAKKENDDKMHSCIFKPESLTRWENWIGTQAFGRVIVRDKRSNTRTGKVLWAGTHFPGKNGVPKNCGLSNAWNYLRLPEKEALAVARVLNSPIADTAIRSIGSKRNINVKDLKKLGLPKLSDEMVDLLSRESIDFCQANALILLGVFDLNNREADKLLRGCGWVSVKEITEILKFMSMSSVDEATKLLQARPKKRGQIKKAAKSMGRR